MVVAIIIFIDEEILGLDSRHSSCPRSAEGNPEAGVPSSNAHPILSGKWKLLDGANQNHDRCQLEMGS